MDSNVIDLSKIIQVERGQLPQKLSPQEALVILMTEREAVHQGVSDSYFRADVAIMLLMTKLGITAEDVLEAEEKVREQYRRIVQEDDNNPEPA